jgi:hypothetical protein
MQQSLVKPFHELMLTSIRVCNRNQITNPAPTRQMCAGLPKLQMSYE